MSTTTNQTTAVSDSEPNRRSVDSTAWTVLHDFGFLYGGAERVTRDICRTINSAQPMHYIAGNPAVLQQMSKHYARLIRVPVSQKTYRFVSPIYGDLLQSRPPIEGHIIASSYAFCHQVPATGLRVVYCHSPFRQAWSGNSTYRSQGSLPERMAAWMFRDRWRRQDRSAAKDSHFVATSNAVAARIAQYYQTSALAIIPPAYDDATYHNSDGPTRTESYLWVGRIVEPYKRLGMVIEYFNQHRHRHLIVAGDGRDRSRLESTANSNITFVGWQDEKHLVQLYRSSKALIFPSEDDFGIAAVEAMACGLPVIAYGAGGALDTVIEHQTGLFFPEPTVSTLATAISEFEGMSWDSDSIAGHARRRYGSRRFQEDLADVLTSLDD